MPATLTATSTILTRLLLPENDRHSLIVLLDERLADTADPDSHVSPAHRNVKDLNFSQLHELFDQLAAEAFPRFDLIAERACALGGLAMETVRMATERWNVPESPGKTADGQSHLRAFLDRSIFTANGRKAIDVADEQHDRSSADLFTQNSRTADKQLWFTEAYVQS